jgi:geranylgeranyl pyrophosphate synthase
MNVFEHIDLLKVQSRSRNGDIFALLEDELRAALSLYWQTASAILKESGIRLQAPSATFYSLENNFFSALFLYSFHRAGIPAQRRRLYAAANHCLRGMVTGCDNILDDEYKQTLDTDLPAGAARFRSVLDIMVSDRVLFALLLESHRASDVGYDEVLAASAASLHALTRSGIQEASEESGITGILTPEEVISQVHHYKTGLLFLCPWGVPAVLEPLRQETIAPIQQALFHIGMGCQLMDDMVDLPRDMREKRHNYVASWIYHLRGSQSWAELDALAAAAGTHEKAPLLLRFPEARWAVAHTARTYLQQGLQGLFTPDHQHLVAPAMAFLFRRIGTEHLMSVLDSDG